MGGGLGEGEDDDGDGDGEDDDGAEEEGGAQLSTFRTPEPPVALCQFGQFGKPQLAFWQRF